jgi:hypothetical protein
MVHFSPDAGESKWVLMFMYFTNKNSDCWFDDHTKSLHNRTVSTSAATMPSSSKLLLIILAAVCAVAALPVQGNHISGFTLWGKGGVAVASLGGLNSDKMTSICQRSNQHDLAIQVDIDSHINALQVGNMTMELYGPNDYYHATQEAAAPHYSLFGHGRRAHHLSTRTLAPGIYTLYATSTAWTSANVTFALSRAAC